MSLVIWVLSLSRASDRRSESAAVLANYALPFRFFDAIDGRDLSEDEVLYHQVGVPLRKFKRPLTAGEVACALSHRSIWKTVAQGPDGVALVLEDDFDFLRDPRSFLKAASASAGTLEDVLIKLDGPAGKGERVGRLADCDLVLSRQLPARTTGYLIGRRAAANLLEAAGPVTRPVDMDLKHYWEHDVPVLVADPQLVAERKTAISGIGVNRDAIKSKSRAKRLYSHLSYQTNLLINRARNPLRAAQIPALQTLIEQLK